MTEAIKVVGWLLIGFGFFTAIRSMVTVSFPWVIASLIFSGLFIWGGWKLAHLKKRKRVSK